MMVDVYYTKKQIGVGMISQIKNVSGVLVASITMAACVYGVASMFSSVWLKLVFGVLAGLVWYVSFCYVFNISNLKSIIKERRL